MSRVLYACLLLVVCASFCFADGEAKAKTYGKKITLKEVTSIKTITSDPQKLAGKEVLVSGKVTSVCKGKGCWVEIMTPDSEKIICKSLDESVTVPMDCEGRMIEVQGKVKMDKKASGKAEMKKEGEGAAHACPAPKVLVAMEGATFLDAPTTATSPVVAPAATIEKKDAPATTDVKAAPAPEKKDAPATTDVKTAPAPDKKDAVTPEKKDAPASEKKTPPAPPTPTK